MVTTGKRALAPPDLIERWVRDAAELLGARLRAAALPRQARPAARRLLAEAFEALEAGTVRPGLAGELDRLATAPVPPIGFRQRIARPARLTVIDEGLVTRCVARWLLGEAIEGRTERFIAALGEEVTGRLAQLAGAPREGRYPDVSLDLTEG